MRVLRHFMDVRRGVLPRVCHRTPQLVTPLPFQKTPLDVGEAIMKKSLMAWCSKWLSLNLTRTIRKSWELAMRLKSSGVIM